MSVRSWAWPLLRGPVGRLVPWAALATGGVVSAVAVWWRAATVDEAAQLVPLVRFTSLLLAASAAAAVEDGAEALAETAPLGRLRRRTLAVLATGAVVAIGWGVIVAVALAVGGPARSRGPGLPVGGLAIEFVALCVVGWALVAATIRWAGWRGSGTRAGAGLLVLVAVSLMSPDVNAWLWAASGEVGAWDDAHARWVGLGAAAVATFVALSRDTASPSPRRLLPC